MYCMYVGVKYMHIQHVYMCAYVLVHPKMHICMCMYCMYVYVSASSKISNTGTTYRYIQ
jgi:hypothetical protein